MNSTLQMKNTLSDARIYTVEGSFLLVMNVLAVCGNLLVSVAVYRNRSLLTVPYLFVLVLSMADLSVALLCLPFCVSSAIQGRWIFGYVFCQFNGFFIYYWAAISIYILSLTAINRFFRVCKPDIYRRLFTMKNSLLVIVAGSVLSIIGGLVATISGPVIYEYNPRRFFCSGHYDVKNRQIAIGSTLHVVHVFLPMLVILVCYFKVFRTIRYHNATVIAPLQARTCCTARNINAFREVRVTRLLFAVLVGFALCWTPVLVLGILGHAVSAPLPRVADLIYTFLGFASSVINPFIYGAMNRAFRKEFLKILRCYH